MPVSTALELVLRERWDGNVTFQHEQEPIVLKLPEGVWRDIGAPTNMRVRLEDTWNDPRRQW